MIEPFARPFYAGKEWKDCRKSFISEKKGLCEKCLEMGLYNPGEIVHHLVKLTPENIGDPTISLNHANLQLLCRKHHGEAHRTVPRRYMFDEFGNCIINDTPHE